MPSTPSRSPYHPPTFDEEAELRQSGDGDGDGSDDRTKPRKREKRATKVASRRRSTLNPWELESLISGGVGVASPSR